MNKNHKHRKLDKVKQQKIMPQMKEQDKTPEKQLNEVELFKKRIQNNDIKDDWEDARDV